MKTLLSLVLVTFALAIVSHGQSAAQLKKATEISEIAGEHYDKGEYNDAILEYTKYLKIRPSRPNIWFNRGLAYHQKSLDSGSPIDIEKAIADFSQAIKLSQNDVDYYIHRAAAYADLIVLDVLKYSPLAAADFTQAIRLKPNSADLYRQRGDVYKRSFQANKAFEDYNSAIKLNSKDAEAFYGRADANSSNGDFASAKSDAETALRLNPKHEYARGLLEFVSGKLTETSPTSPAKAETWKSLSDQGLAFLARKDSDRAIASFQKALQMHPKKFESNFVGLYIVRDRSLLFENIARAYLIKNDFDKALENYVASQKDFLSVMIAAYKDENSNFDVIDSNIEMTEMIVKLGDELVAIGERGVNAFPRNSLTGDQNIQLFKIEVLKLSASETIASFLDINSKFKLAIAKECDAKGISLCGNDPLTKKYKTYGSESLDDINKAIKLAPTLKKLYLHRADVYRYIGKRELANADVAKAKTLEDN